MTPSPLISIVVAVFNGAETLPRCLDSIAGQTYPNTELIVMDGGSTDGTVSLLEARAGEITYWETQPDRGIYHAWNKALTRAKGDWICFLGADDFFWDQDALASLAAHLPPAHSPIRVVYGQVAVLSQSGEVVRHDGRPWPQSRAGLAWTLTLPHPGLLHHRRLFDDHGLFDETYRIVGDYELLLRELKPHGPSGEALFVPRVTVGFGHGGVSNAPRTMAAMLKEISRARARHGFSRWALPSKVRIKMLLSAWIYRVAGDSGFRRMADKLRRLRGKPPVWSEHP